MQRYQPNTRLTPRLLLREELAYEPAAGFQIWEAIDITSGQDLLAKLFADGRLELYRDGQPFFFPAEPKQARSVRMPRRRARLRWPLGGLILLALLGGGGWYAYTQNALPRPVKRWVRGQISAWNRSSRSTPSSPTVTPSDLRTPPVPGPEEFTPYAPADQMDPSIAEMMRTDTTMIMDTTAIDALPDQRSPVVPQPPQRRVRTPERTQSSRPRDLFIKDPELQP